jgi:hypothetical protein
MNGRPRPPYASMLAMAAAARSGGSSGAGVVNDEYLLPPWIYPPSEFEPIETGPQYISLPAIGATVTIAQVQIPTGHNGIITGVANNFVGGGWTEGTGSVTWQIARDNAPVDGYSGVLGSLGSPANPTRLPSGFRVFENQIITFTVTNVSIVVAGQLIGARLMGWYYPIEYESQNLQTM